MKISRSLSAAVIAIGAVLFTAPPTAHADTYQLFDLGSGHLRGIVGITTSGTVVIFDNGQGLCGVGSFGCYETWVDGTRLSDSATNPGLVYDNGTPCMAPPGFSDVMASTCNNGRQIFGTGILATPPYRGTFDGPDPVTDRISAGGVLDEVRLNSSGDFVAAVNEGLAGIDADGEITEGIDLTTRATPEPAGIFLLGTGVLAALGSMRRRLQQT